MVWTQSVMDTSQTYLQSQRFGKTAYARRVCLILFICVFTILSVASRCVTDAAVLHEDSLPILLGPLGASGGGVPHGSRLGVIQRSRRDVVNNTHLMQPSLEATTTNTPSNIPLPQRGNDRFLASSEEYEGGSTVDILSHVTPPHWGPSDPLPTDPTRPPTTPTESTINSTTQPTLTYSYPTTTEVQPITINSTTPTTTTTPSSPIHPGKEISLHQEDKYLVPISSGATTEVGNIVKTNADLIGSNDPKSINRKELPIRRFLFFKCWPSSHKHPVNNSKEPPWVTDIALPFIFPALLLVSWTFTSVALILHILVPDLRANMGKIFMCYILSLWLKCIITLCSLFLGRCAPHFEKDKEVCIAIAFVSYMLSMSYRFWLNIMCFDIWRKVSNLVRLQHVQPVNLIYYHLWGWGMPAMFGLMALLMCEYAPANVVKPGFVTKGTCWFDQAEAIHQFLYLNLPGGFLHIANIGFVLKTRQNCSLMQQTSIPETQESNNNSVGRIHATTNYINEFNLQFRILNFMIGLWILWSISIIIKLYADLWYFQVIPGFLISLQGLIIFFIFISNNHKRQLIQRKFPFLKCNNCCIKPKSKSITRQQSSSISEPSSERRKKVSMMSVTSLTSLFSLSATTAIEDIAENVPEQEMSSVSSASYDNTKEGGSVHLNLSLNRSHSLPPREDTNGDPICELPMSLDKERQKSNTRKLGHIADFSELTLDPSNLILFRSVSCTYPPPNNVMDVNPVTVPVSNTLYD